jgi:peptide deformylase
MSLLPVRVLGDSILRRRADAIIKITDATRRLADDMYETMYAAHGIGLAAPQVGVAERLFITDVDGARYVMINPELVIADGEIETQEEGCLSIPEVMGDVSRPSHVVMRATSLDGEPITVEATGLLGRCLLHELDHLNGRLFIDHLSLLKRRRALAEWAKLEADFPGHIRVLTAQDPGDPGREDSAEDL